MRKLVKDWDAGGLDLLDVAYRYVDMTAFGRQEALGGAQGPRPADPRHAGSAGRRTVRLGITAAGAEPQRCYRCAAARSAPIVAAPAGVPVSSENGPYGAP
jgi:hypothetical protein